MTTEQAITEIRQHVGNPKAYVCITADINAHADCTKRQITAYCEIGGYGLPAKNIQDAVHNFKAKIPGETKPTDDADVIIAEVEG